MGILARIEEIRAVEHRKLRLALARAESQLKELEAKRIEASRVTPKLDMWGEPLQRYTAAEAPTKEGKHLAELVDAWGPFEEACLKRLDQWEEQLWPMIRRWSHGDVPAEEIQQMAADLLTSRDIVDQRLRKVRNLAWFVQEMNSTLLVVYAALELCDRAEQDEVIPALLSGSRETADKTERSFTADDVARNLRAAGPSVPPPAPPPLGPLGRLKSWISGSR
jgi:hypothetical protein